MEKNTKETIRKENEKELSDDLIRTFLKYYKQPYHSLDDIDKFIFSRLRALYPNLDYNVNQYLQDLIIDSPLKSREEKIERIPEKNDLLDNINKRLQDLEKENLSIKEVLYDHLLSSELKSKTQHIPINIYLDTDEPEDIYNAYIAVLDFLENLEFSPTIEFKAIKGSWIKRFIASSKKLMTSEEVTERFKEAEYAIEVNTILKPQSEVEKNQSEALMNIIKSLDKINNAVIRIGSLLVLKITNKQGEVSVQVRTLTISELHFLNKHPELSNRPVEILEALSKLDNNGTQIE